jgi:FAD-dependent halogenase
MSEEFDLIVVGGGPAGSTVASFVAMQGHKVLVLERERFPRHQIGESLLPVTIHGISVMLGVSEELKNANFPYKRGGTFRWGKSQEPWTFEFKTSPFLDEPTGYALQVRRAEFDNILLNNSRRKGAEVREQCAVKEVITENDRVVGVIYTDAEGNTHTVRAKYVADASGHQSRIHEEVGKRIYSKFFQNIALYAYYDNGKRMPAPYQGNTVCIAFEHGWFWYIPLSEKMTSVGAVIAREHADKIKDMGHDNAFKFFLDACPMMQDFLSEATRTTEAPYDVIRLRKDYSYSNSRFWKPGLVLLGDAACFIDPVFSSGVHFATYSGLIAARSINTCLANNIDEERCFSEYEMRYRREFGAFYEFLISFYDTGQETDSYFWSARNVLNTEEKANEAFVSLVSGISTTGEQVYSNPEEFFKVREGIGEVFEQHARKKSQRTPLDPTKIASTFHPTVLNKKLGITVEHIIKQAHLMGINPAEMQIREGGLVPSEDGLHWAEVPAEVASETSSPVGAD